MSALKTSVHIEALKVLPDGPSSEMLHLSEENFHAADSLRSALRDLQAAYVMLEKLRDLAQSNLATSTKES